MTIDSRRGLVYWILYSQPWQEVAKAAPIFRSAICGQNKSEITLNHAAWRPNSIAFDWLTGNMYIIESFRARIVACANLPSNDCAIVLERTQLKLATFLVSLLPNQGRMFWVEVSRRGS